MSVPIGYNKVKANTEVKNEFRYPFDAVLWVLDGTSIIGLEAPDGSTVPLEYTPTYGSYYDTQTQASAGANVVNTILIRQVDSQAGVSIVDNSKVTFAVAGVYNIQFSFQLTKTDSGSDDIDIWFAKNGTDIAYSNTRVTLSGNNAKAAASWNFMTAFNAGDYIQMRWSSPDATIALQAIAPMTGPVRPGIPSVILTASQVR